VIRGDWPDLRQFLQVRDHGTVIAAAEIGFAVAPEAELPEIISALVEIAKAPRFIHEEDVDRLLDAHSGIAREVASQIASTERLGGKAELDVALLANPESRTGGSLEGGHPTGA